MTETATPKIDIYTAITEKIVASLEQGSLPWRKPWSAEHMAQNVIRPLRWNNQAYTGVNVLVLWSTAAEKEYHSPYWMTFKQALALKGTIRKGEKATQVVYADKFTKEEPDEKGQLQTKVIPFLKSYFVFNACQITGLSDSFYAKPEQTILNPETRIKELEEYFAKTNANINIGTQACYKSTSDQIEMPPFESFYDAASYYAVLGHEMTHWTKHKTRLDRDFGRLKWGDEGYAKEELVAELGSCFLAADLGFEPELRPDHAAYIQNWLEVLKNDKKFIFSAASHAQKAVEHLHSYQAN